MAFVNGVKPFVEGALNGKNFTIPLANSLKPIDHSLTDANGIMQPFVAGVELDEATGEFMPICAADSEINQGKPRANGQPINVAIIPVRGVLMKNGVPVMAGLCGTTLGTAQIAQLISEAYKDPNISAIVLYADGPGGGVDGIEHLARMVGKKDKPVVSYVDGGAFSATYWAIANSDKIIISEEKTSYVGSIGVFTTHVNEAQRLANEGLQVSIIRARTSPDKVTQNSIEALTEDAQAEIEDRLDTTHAQFISTIKAGRGDRLKSEYIFTGKVYNGEQAVANGLVDKVGTLQDAVNAAAKLASKANKPSTNSKPQSNNDMKVNLQSAPILAARLGLEATAEEVELNAEHFATLEAHLASVENAEQAHATALQVVEDKLTTASQALQTEKDKVSALEKWKAETEGTGNRGGDAGNGGGNPKPKTKYQSQAEAYAAKYAPQTA